MKTIKPNTKRAFHRLQTAIKNKSNRVRAISKPFCIFVQKNGERVPVIGGIFPNQRDADSAILDLFAGSAIRVMGLKRIKQ